MLTFKACQFMIAVEITFLSFFLSFFLSRGEREESPSVQTSVVRVSGLKGKS